MADVAAAPKVKKAAKAKKPATHPRYSEMIAAAVKNLKSRGGSSRSAILKYIASNYNLGGNQAQINSFLKVALKSGVKNGSLKQAKGVGASGSFKLGEVQKVAKPKKATKPKAAKPKKTKTPKKAAKKPAAKKAAAKKPAAKKPAAKPKKTKTPKKAAAKPKKATKSPKKAKAAKPKKTKTPKKASK
jgi:histone H1/5